MAYPDPMLFISVLLQLTSYSAHAQIYSAPKWISQIGQGVDAIYIYSQEITVAKESEIPKALQEGRAQVAQLAMTRVRTKTESSKKESRKNRKKKFKFEERYSEKIHEISDAMISTEIIKREKSSSALVLYVEYTVNPNENALKGVEAAPKEFQHLFSLVKKRTDGVAFFKTFYARPRDYADTQRSFFCLSKEQEKSQKFMDTLCQMAGYQESVSHRVFGPIPKKINNAGRKMNFHDYIAELEERGLISHYEGFFCSDLWINHADPIDFHPMDLGYKTPYVRLMKVGESSLQELSCR